MFASAPLIELSETELNLVASALDTPLVKKYFISLSRAVIVGIVFDGDVPDPKSGEIMESFRLRVARERGKVEVLEQLLQIEAAKQDQ